MRKPPRSPAPLHPYPPALILLLTLFLGGCSLDTAVPTLIPVALAPFIPETSTPLPTVVTTLATPEPPTVTPTVGPPTPEGSGVRPAQARLLYVPDAGLETPVNQEWRPPPMQPPISYHPDDHYWFIRPIPSGFRNYDLEWYPYGNDIQLTTIPQLRIHHGIDLPNEPGTPILAAASGTVVFTGTLPSPRDGINYYGNTIIIQHDWQWQGKDVFTLYAHTLEVLVEPGDRVEQGQLIAGVGQSGSAGGPHLHFEVRIGQNNYNETRNPALWIVPFEGYGTLAGRLVDRRGQFISSVAMTLRPLNSNAIIRSQQTYDLAVKSDEMWQENFVFADLPAGKYELRFGYAGNSYRREVTIYPGRTTFDLISTFTEFSPTTTPLPSPTTEGETIEPTPESGV